MNWLYKDSAELWFSSLQLTSYLAPLPGRRPDMDFVWHIKASGKFRGTLSRHVFTAKESGQHIQFSRRGPFGYSELQECITLVERHNPRQINTCSGKRVLIIFIKCIIINGPEHVFVILIKGEVVTLPWFQHFFFFHPIPSFGPSRWQTESSGPHLSATKSSVSILHWV